VWCGVGHVDPDEEVRGAGVRNERRANYVRGKVGGRGMILLQGYEWKDDFANCEEDSCVGLGNLRLFRKSALKEVFVL
jgi:hypothetical protein